MPYIIFVIAAILGSTVFAAPAKADVWCEIMKSNPTIQGAEDMIIDTAADALKRGTNLDTAGRKVAADIVNNCPQYVTIVIKAADNLGG